jgi:hypothetical protein
MSLLKKAAFNAKTPGYKDAKLIRQLQKTVLIHKAWRLCAFALSFFSGVMDSSTQSKASLSKLLI